MLISATAMQRTKELYNDPIYRDIINKLQEDLIDLHCEKVSKYIEQLKDHGLPETEAVVRLLGVMIAQNMQGLHDCATIYTRENLMEMIGHIYDCIHMDVKDDEMFGDKKPS